MDLGIRDRVALVGGASRGIGQAAARALAGEGVKVALVARNADAVQTAAAELAREAGVSTLGIAADLATAEGCQRSIDETVARFGKLDILVANAGGPPPGGIDALDDSAWQRAFELTFLSTVRLCRAAVAAMLPGGWGRIAIVGSSSMVAPIPNLALSSGLRPGLRGVAKLLADRYAKDGVRINVVAPGLIATERLSEIAGDTPAESYARWAQEIPVGRLGEPAELGSVIAFLCSERACYVTGQLLLVDGGRDRAN
jgi:3-oxoacyl-[acyl-carrier protein] reductase